MCVCVWIIWTDVKLLLQFVLLFRKAGGQEPMTVCPGQRRPDSMGVQTYLQFFIFRPTWHGAKPRTPPRLIWFLHGFRQFPQSVSSNLAIFCLNLALFYVFILCIHFISSTWQRAKPRTLNIDKVLDENLVLFEFDITYSTIFYFLGASTLSLSR